ncbi:MAG: alpha/beta hydrolase [Lacipirellulaceae bacterium]
MNTKVNHIAFPTSILLPALAIVLSHPNSLVAKDTRPIVIIHGAWGGAHHWKAVDDALTHKHGRTVRRASLTGLGERSHLATPKVNLDTHIRDVVNLIEFDDLNSVILIAHSYGGAVGQGVVEAIPKRIATVIYIDSSLLEDGECCVEDDPKDRELYTRRAKEDGDGWLVPVDWPNPMRDTPHPLATFLQPIKLTSDIHKQVPATYWLLADGKPPEQDKRYRFYQRAVERKLNVKVFSWGHNPQRERPDDLTKELVASISKSN